MAAYVIQPHRLRLDYTQAMEAAVRYALDNQLHIELWPVGQIIPTSCTRINEKLEITTFGDTAQNWVVLDELEIGW